MEKPDDAKAKARERERERDARRVRKPRATVTVDLGDEHTRLLDRAVAHLIENRGPVEKRHYWRRTPNRSVALRIAVELLAKAIEDGTLE